MKRVTDALAVSRSNTYERSRSPRPRPERYSKAEDAFLLPLIVELLGGRQTYGYRRIQRLLNRQLVASGRTPVNHKRVYRIMRQNNLLLARFTGSRPDKAHTGKVSTLKRNQRWCSDGFEIACDNGERVRVIFALDTCDREMVAYTATTAGIVLTWRKASCWHALKNGSGMSKHCSQLNGSPTTAPATRQEKQ